MRRGTFIVAAAIAALALAAGAAAGCGGGGGDDDAATPTVAATAVPFDRNLMTGVVLNEGDVPAGYVAERVFAPRGESFTSVFLGDGLRYQSTVIRFETPALAQTEFQRNRKVLPAFGAREANYQVPGTDSAFIYSVFTPPGLAAWAIRDNFVLFLQIAPMDAANPNPVAVDQAEFARIAQIVGQRTAALVEAPQSITPVIGATVAPPALPTAAPTP